MIDLVRRCSKLWHRCDVTLRDLPLALLFAGISFIPVFHGSGTQLGDLPARPMDGWAWVAIAAQALPLAVRRRLPAVCLLLVSAGFVFDQLRHYHTFAGNALAIALLSAGAHLHRFRRTMIVVLSLAYLPLAVTLDRMGSPEGIEGFALFYLVVCLAWGAGSWLRSYRMSEAERRRHVAEATRTAERARIARELHDVVTHHVTAMVVQTESARYLTGAPDKLDRTLSAVTDTGRRAIADLRHLLDLLTPEHDGEVRPAIGPVSELVDQTRAAGQPVEFTQEGEPAASAGSAEFVAYRIVQETLTNALKYARGCPTTVQVRYRETQIAVDVVSSGAASNPPDSPGRGGRGLAGLHDRVSALSGEFDAGFDGDQFAVRARVPTGSVT